MPEVVSSPIIKIISDGEDVLTPPSFPAWARSWAPSWPWCRPSEVTQLPAGPTHCHSPAPTFTSALFFSSFCRSTSAAGGICPDLSAIQSLGCFTSAFVACSSKTSHFCALIWRFGAGGWFWQAIRFLCRRWAGFWPFLIFSSAWQSWGTTSLVFLGQESVSSACEITQHIFARSPAFWISQFWAGA